MRDNKKISNCSFVLSLVTTESFSLPGFSLFLLNQLNRPSAEKEYKLRGGLYLENYPQIQSKTKQKR